MQEGNSRILFYNKGLKQLEMREEEYMEYIIRLAEEKDAQEIHDIYGAYVERLDITFTVVNPSVDEYRKKIRETKMQYPFFVAEDGDGRILGYCYGSRLRPHDAYKWNVESTIMLSPDAPRRKGIATSLYTHFFEALKKQHYQYVYAVIVDINEPSIALHNSLGFKEVGHFENAGYKAGTWLGITWMQKFIGDLGEEVKEPTAFS